MFDVRLLASFVAVARLRHFGKAALAVHATQPGISQHVARLERQLGFALLVRSKRSVELTAAGDTFLRYAERVIALCTRMEEESRRVAHGLLGRISLGLSSSVIYSDLPSHIAAFKEAMPDVRVQLRVQSGDQLQSLLDFGEIDVALTTLPIEGSDYRSTVVSSQPVGVAIRIGHPLASRRRVTISALRNEPFIVVPRERHPEIYDALISRLHSVGAALQVAAHEISFQNVLARVAIGEGVALVPLGFRVEHADAVRVVPLQDPELSRMKIRFVHRVDGETAVTARLLRMLSHRSIDKGS